MRHWALAGCLLMLSLGSPAAAQHGSGGGPPAAPYAGQERRAVTSLSEQDIADLEAGRGWGLAKPAEINGFPGPLHVLELADALRLTPEQRTMVQKVYEAMKANAQNLGARYIAAEKALDAAFKAEAAAASLISERVGEAEKLRAQLRLTHLLAHVEVAPVLTPDQIQKYAELRGYTDATAHDHHPGRHKH
jgi:Spy/CpxP family protein refolding chaperone